MARRAASADAGGFAAEVQRLRAAGVAGSGGRLRDLFEYLAARGPDAPSASQADIAAAVFGQGTGQGTGQASGQSDDATVRVYVHRLRKRLDDFYAGDDALPASRRLTIPAGAYALRSAAAGAGAGPAAVRSGRWRRMLLPACAALTCLAGAVVIGRLSAGPAAPAANAFWQPLLASDRPIMVVVGDYYMFGEINAFHPEQGRLIRDFRIDSPTDLIRAQDEEPERYEAAEDVGLTYLPLSSAHALRAILPLLAADGRRVAVMPASALTSETVRDNNIVYVGLVSGMGLLEDVTFARSSIAVGETYDELADTVTRQRYVSEEARRLASPVYYRDYAYFARFREPGGALVAVIAGNRDTALRGVAPILAGDLPGEVADVAAGGSVEGLFQVTGQQGADLSERLLAVRPRDRQPAASR